MALALAFSSSKTPTPPTRDLEDAVNDFQGILSSEQRAELQKLRAVPDAGAVLSFTAQLDKSSASQKCPNKGTRLIPVLQFVRESAAVIDTFVSSHPEIAALVWGSVKLTMQVILNFSSYYEQVSDLFMQFAKDCPRFAEYQALFPSSPGLQKAVCDFNASIIRCCRHVVEASQRTWQTNLLKSFLRSFQQEFNPDLEDIRRCGREAKQEIKLAKAQADHQYQSLQQAEREAVSHQRQRVRRFFRRAEVDLDTIKTYRLHHDTRQAEESRLRLLDSLSSYDYLTPYKKACKIRHPGTAEWLFQLTAFSQWEEGSSSPWLWCSGKIGSGKTVLTASAIEHTYSHESRDGEAITFFFPQFDDSASLSAETALRSIIRQSLDPVRLSSDWEARLTELNRKPFSELDEITALLRQRIDESKAFYVFIDALDEFELAERRALLGSLASVVSGSPCLRVFFSSRESLSSELRDRIPNIGMVSMASTEARIDIATFVEETLKTRQKSDELIVQDESILGDIWQALINHADGMFLWVTFLLDEICAQTCDNDIRNALGRPPKNLTETLGRALHRIVKRQKSSVAIKAFKWIAVAKRPLTLDELREAMSIEIRQPSSRPGQLVNEIHKLPAWCENLVRVEEESGTTEFAHKAVYEFIAEGLSGPDFTEFHFKLEDADHEVGEICVTYLHFSDFVTTMTQRPQPVRIDPAAMARSALQNSRHLPKSISSAIMKSHKSAQTKTDVAGVLATYNRSDNAEPINALQDQHPFLKYASVHWISHTTRFSSRTSSTWSMWRQILTQGHYLAKTPRPSHQEPGALNSATFRWSLANRHFAVIRLLGVLGKMGSADNEVAFEKAVNDVDEELLNAILEGARADEIPSIALEKASRSGHIELVERLLSSGANVNAATDGGYTALIAASGSGYVEIVEQLLSAEANVNAATDIGWSALRAASFYGHVEVVERLLSAGAKVNEDLDGWTALQAASFYGHVEVVELLLSAGANVNAGIKKGVTALYEASKPGHIEAVK